jgi:hypothetical protein
VILVIRNLKHVGCVVKKIFNRFYCKIVLDMLRLTCFVDIVSLCVLVVHVSKYLLTEAEDGSSGW